MSHIIFVYGTLKNGFSNHSLLADSEFLGEASTVDMYALYAAGIPFVNKDEPISTIQGELYEVNSSTLERIDRLEGHPDYYRREEIEVFKKSIGYTETITAWIYFHPEKIGRLIEDGRY